MKGRIHLEWGEENTAFSFFNKAVEQNPNNINAQLLFGQVRMNFFKDADDDTLQKAYDNMQIQKKTSHVDVETEIDLLLSYS